MPGSPGPAETSAPAIATMPGPPRGGGITMLDAAALVTGGAVASVHFREFEDEIAALTLLGWALLVPAFAWLALTAAGPFVFLVRRFSRRPDGYPGPDDWIWLAFGLPWLVARWCGPSAAGGLPDESNSVYTASLFLGLAAATIPAVGRLRLSLPDRREVDWAPARLLLRPADLVDGADRPGPSRSPGRSSSGWG